jgi:hypothetical protein
MKLEFFADAFEGAGLLLLYSGNPSEVDRLRGQVSRLGVLGTNVHLNTLDYVEAVDSCVLTLSSAKLGRGVLAQGGTRCFELRLAPSEWDRVTGLLEPFCKPEPDAERVRFQYLHDHGGIEVIYSTSRQW